MIVYMIKTQKGKPPKFICQTCVIPNPMADALIISCHGKEYLLQEGARGLEVRPHKEQAKGKGC